MSGKVLITGASGFIGMALWRSLANLGYEVVACTTRDGRPAGAPEGRVHVLRLPAEAFTRIVADERPGWVLHCAGPSSVEHTFRERTNPFVDSVVVTESVLRAIAHASPQTKMVLLSSTAVYGQPSLPIEGPAPRAPSRHGFRS
jgi:nucleoside-diphosphate-sugar epimerase